MSKYVLKTLVYFFAALTFVSLFVIIGFILIKGLPHLNMSLFSWTYTSENISLMPAIISTVILVFGSLLLALPIGIFAGFYLVEYAKRFSLGEDDAASFRHFIWDSFHCVWFIRHALLCRFSGIPIFSFIRNIDVGYYGFASHHSFNRRSAFIR